MPAKSPQQRLLEAALAFPEARVDHPWGSTVVKVRGKVFVFLGHPGADFSCSMKLPETHAAALMLPFSQPTAYGLGKSGWVTASFAKGDKVPVPLLVEWLRESWCAVAPKRLVKSFLER